MLRFLSKPPRITTAYHAACAAISFAAKITFRAKTSNTDGDGLKFGYSTFPLFSLSI